MAFHLPPDLLLDEHRRRVERAVSDTPHRLGGGGRAQAFATVRSSDLPAGRPLLRRLIRVPSFRLPWRPLVVDPCGCSPAC